LTDLDLDARLIVGGGGERLALAGRNGRVPIDQVREHPAEGFDPER